MSEMEAVRCPVCLHPFDANHHIPKISPACGHTVCKECLIQVLKMPTPKCPLDKLKFDRDLLAIDAFPTNFLGKELLEMKGKWTHCEFHKKENEMICMTDKTLVCSNCVIFGEHKGHDVKLLLDFEETLKQKKNQLSALSEKISNIPSGFAKTFEEKKKIMRSLITDTFQIFRLKIAREELEMLFQFESIFIDEEINMINLVSSTAFDMPINLEAKFQEFNDALSALSNPNILKLAEEDFSYLEEEFSEKFAPLEAKQTEKISEILAVFQKSLPAEDLLKDFNVFKSLSEEIVKFQKPQSSQIADLVIPSVELDISHEAGTNTLKIQDPTATTQKYPTLRKSDIEQITQLKCQLKLTNETINISIIYVLILLSKYLVNLDSISLIINGLDNINYEIPFYSLILTLFSQPEKLKNIEIDTSNVVLRDLGPLYLFENILPKIQNLKSFDCTLSKSHTTSAILRVFDFTNNKNLERFRLNLIGAILEEEDVIQFLAKTPNVKDLLLGFGQTGLTDQALESFSANVLPSLNKVERLEVGLWETKLTDVCVAKFLANLPDVRNLLVGLQYLPISDTNIQNFLEKKLKLLSNLKELQIFLNNTNVSENLIRKIQNWTPSEILQLDKLFVE